MAVVIFFEKCSMLVRRHGGGFNGKTYTLKPIASNYLKGGYIIEAKGTVFAKFTFLSHDRRKDGCGQRHWSMVIKGHDTAPLYPFPGCARTLRAEQHLGGWLEERIGGFDMEDFMRTVAERQGEPCNSYSKGSLVTVLHAQLSRCLTKSCPMHLLNL